MINLYDLNSYAQNMQVLPTIHLESCIQNTDHHCKAYIILLNAVYYNLIIKYGIDTIPQPIVML